MLTDSRPYASEVSRFEDEILKFQGEFGVGFTYTFDKLFSGCLCSDFNSRVALKILIACEMIYLTLFKQSPFYHASVLFQEIQNAINCMKCLIRERLDLLGSVSERDNKEKALHFIYEIKKCSSKVISLASRPSRRLRMFQTNLEVIDENDREIEEKIQYLLGQLTDSLSKSQPDASGIILELKKQLDDERELSIDVSCLFEGEFESDYMLSANVIKGVLDEISPLAQLNSPRSVEEIKEPLSGPQLVNLLRGKVERELHETSMKSLPI